MNQILIASLWDLYHALFGEVLGSTPWLFFFFFLGPRVVPSLAVWCWQSSGKQNKEKATAPVSSVKQRKAMKREQAIVHEAFSSCFFFLGFSKSKLKQDRSQVQGRKSRAEIGYTKFAKFASFFFLTKNAWSFWAKRLDEKNKIGKRVEDKWRSSKVSAWEMTKTAAERVRLPQQPLQKHPNSLYNNSRPIKSASFSWDDTPTPSRSTESLSVAVTLKPIRLEPKGTDSIHLVHHEECVQQTFYCQPSPKRINGCSSNPAKRCLRA